eukprot:TRINITY_DN67408_c1_g1_i10.p1 TRINITY_DN67408_c1_g1~~TRINITY_DN67408_c1_g1_i10.p1  ORF type:complete len:122 (+),score=2.66 TRINITY_DN67408_c1_g1_i10:119-484(+)
MGVGIPTTSGLSTCAVVLQAPFAMITWLKMAVHTHDKSPAAAAGRRKLLPLQEGSPSALLRLQAGSPPARSLSVAACAAWVRDVPLRGCVSPLAQCCLRRAAPPLRGAFISVRFFYGRLQN